MIILRIAVKGPHQTPVRASKAFVVFLIFCCGVTLSYSYIICERRKFPLETKPLPKDVLHFGGWPAGEGFVPIVNRGHPVQLFRLQFSTIQYPETKRRVIGGIDAHHHPVTDVVFLRVKDFILDLIKINYQTNISIRQRLLWGKTISHKQKTIF